PADRPPGPDTRRGRSGSGTSTPNRAARVDRKAKDHASGLPLGLYDLAAYRAREAATSVPRDPGALAYDGSRPSDCRRRAGLLYRRAVSRTPTNWRFRSVIETLLHRGRSVPAVSA